MSSSGTPRQGGGRRTAVAALTVLALLGAALLVFALAGQVGAPPEPALRSASGTSDGGGSTADASDAGGAEPADVPSTTAEDPSEESGESGESGESVGSGRDEDAVPAAAALPVSEPTALRIESIGLEEELFPIGLGEDGELLAPSGDQAHLPAWFDGSPTPGEDGPAVIEGHVTWSGEPSIFFELGALGTGDRVEVEREDGTVATFEVYDAARYPKDEFPTVDVYGRTDGPELRLITCAGDLDEDGHHLDNTVIYARLVEN
jgi:sortase (surface protein transpeptidase)